MNPDDPKQPGPEGTTPEGQDPQPTKRKPIWARDPDNDADWDDGWDDNAEITDDRDEQTEQDELEERVDELMERALYGTLTDAQRDEMQRLGEHDPELATMFEEVAEDASLLQKISAESVEAHGFASMRRHMLATASMYRILKHTTRWAFVLFVLLIMVGITWDPFGFGLENTVWSYSAYGVALVLSVWTAPAWFERWSANLRSGALGPSRVTLDVFHAHVRSRRRAIAVHDWILTPAYIAGMLWFAWVLWDDRGRAVWAVVFALLGLWAAIAWIPRYRRWATRDWDATTLSLLSDEDREKVRELEAQEKAQREGPLP